MKKQLLTLLIFPLITIAQENNIDFYEECHSKQNCIEFLQGEQKIAFEAQPALSAGPADVMGAWNSPPNQATTEVPRLTVVFSESFAERLEKFTRANVGKFLGIGSDRKIFMAPMLQSEINDGNVSFTMGNSGVIITEKIPWLKVKVDDRDAEAASVDERDRKLYFLLAGALLLGVLFYVFRPLPKSAEP